MAEEASAVAYKVAGTDVSSPKGHASSTPTNSKSKTHSKKNKSKKKKKKKKSDPLPLPLTANTTRPHLHLPRHPRTSTHHAVSLTGKSIFQRLPERKQRSTQQSTPRGKSAKSSMRITTNDKSQSDVYHGKSLPWQDNRTMYGINPLHRFLYQPCEANDPLLKESSPFGHLKHSDSGFAFLRELQTTNRNYYESNKYNWGDTTGYCIGTFDQIFHHPILAFNAFRRYCDTCKNSIESITRATFKGIKKKCRRWLKKNQRI